MKERDRTQRAESTGFTREQEPRAGTNRADEQSADGAERRAQKETGDGEGKRRDPH